MSTPLIWVVTAIYAWVSVDITRKGDIGDGVMYLGYTIANFGILWRLAHR